MRARDKKRRNLMVTIGIIAIVITIIILVVVNVKKGKSNDNEKNGEAQVYELPNTTYTGMEVTDISMEYLAENDETMVSLIITNTSDRVVSEESLNASLINDSNDVIGKTQTYIQSLDIGSQYSITVILKGDLTSTTQVILEKNDQITQNNQEVEETVNNGENLEEQ